MSGQQTLLMALVLLPLAGCLVAVLAPSRVAVATGLTTTSVTFAVSLAVLFSWVRRPANSGFFSYRPLSEKLPTPWRVDLPWLPTLDVRFRLGLDGISLPLVLLTALLTFLCLVYSAHHVPEPGRPRAFVGLVLLLEVGMLGTFLAGDLIVFFVFFEIVLVPMYFLIGIWGGSDRKGHAATKFILYTLLGSAFLLVGFVALYAVDGHTFDMAAIATPRGHGSRAVQDAIFAAFLLGFGIKTPMWPLHSWLPDAHTDAPTVGSVLLAGVLLKMGTYGFIRIALPLAPLGARDFAPWLGGLGAAGILYGALVCLGQRDLKRLIAYSSVGHMGFVLLGIATLTPTGVNAALFGSVAHGLITGLLFFVVGALKDRYHTDSIAEIGGGAMAKVPVVGGLLAFAAIASLGLPGLAGFWGEVLSLFAAYHPAPGLSRPVFLGYLGAGGLGTVLTAGYLLWMLLRVDFGVVPQRWRQVPLRAVAPVELAAWTPLVVLVLAVGLYPRLVLGLTDATVRLAFGGSP